MHPPDAPRKTALSNKAAALAAMVLTAAAGLAAYFLAAGQPLPVVPPFLPNCYLYDTSAQRLAHKSLLAGTALFALLLPFLRGWLGAVLGTGLTARINAWAGRGGLPVWSALAALPLCLWAHRTVGRDQFMLGTLLSVLLLGFGHFLFRHGWLRAVAGALLLAAVLALLGIGFAGPYSFGQHLPHSTYHYFTFLGLGPLLSHGAGILEGSRFFYGLMPQSILAIVDAHFGPLPFIAYVRLVQASLAFFTLLTVACYVRLAPGRPLVWLILVLFWLPWLMITGGDGITPTNSGLRPVALVLAPLVLLLSDALGRGPRSVLLGVTAGLCLLWNLETGICATLGLMAHCVVSQRPGKPLAWLGSLALFCLGLACMLAGEALLLRLGLGHWPQASGDSLVYLMRLFATAGYGGIIWDFDPMALVLFLYPVLLLARLTGAWLRRPLSPRQRFKFAVAVMAMAWGAYYFNRAWSYTLYLSAFQFTLLLADCMPRLVRPKFRWSGPGAALTTRVPAAVVFVALLLGPSITNYGLSGAKDVWRAAQQRWAVARTEGAGTLSGIWLGPKEFQRLSLQKQYLDSLPAGARVVFTSPEQFLLQVMTGRFFDMPEQDIYWGSFAAVDYERNMAALLRHAPDLVLLDPTPNRKAFTEDFQARLAGSHVRIGEEGGWIVLRRKASPEQ